MLAALCHVSLKSLHACHELAARVSQALLHRRHRLRLPLEHRRRMRLLASTLMLLLALAPMEAVVLHRRCTSDFSVSSRSHSLSLSLSRRRRSAPPSSSR